MEEYIGIIKLFAGNYAPVGYLLCQGQVLQIAQYTALFSVLGTTYGGNGSTTFALPDLRSRIPIGAGQGTGLSAYALGDLPGVEKVTLKVDNLPAHSHTATLKANSAAGDSADPTNNVAANTGATDKEYSTVAPNVSMSANAIQVQSVGNNIPVSVIQPCLALNYIICVEGYFPVRP